MDTEVNASSAVGSLLRAIGSWTQPSGRGLLMFRMMTFASSGSALTGVMGAILAAFLFGTGPIGFAIGSSIGFTVSTFLYVQATSRKAIAVLWTHPRLMQHHLMKHYYMGGYQDLDLRTPENVGLFIDEIEDSWSKKSALMCAYQTASSALDEIHARQEAALIDELSNKRPEWYLDKPRLK